MLKGHCVGADGSWVAAITGRGVVSGWSTATGRLVWTWTWDRVKERDSSWWTVSSLATVNYQGRETLVAGVIGIPKPGAKEDDLEPSLVLLDPKDGQERTRLTSRSRISCLLAYAPSQGLLADWDEAGPIRIVDLSGRDEPVSLGSLDIRGTALAFNHVGTQLYASTYSGALARWDAATWTMHRRPGYFESTVFQLMLSPDDTSLLALADDRIHFFDPLTLELQGEAMTDGEVAQIIEDPDGEILYRLKGRPGLYRLTLHEAPAPLESLSRSIAE